MANASRQRKRREKRQKVGAGGAGLLTRRDLAAAPDVHMQTATKWERDGMPIAERGRKGKPSLYRLDDVRAWRAARDEAGATGQLFDVAQERARKERAQAILAEQTFAIRQRDLVPRQEGERGWSAEVAAVRAKLLALPTTLADAVHRIGVLDGVAGVE